MSMQLKYQENYATLKCTVVQLSMKLAIDTVKIDEKGLKLTCLLGLKNQQKSKSITSTRDQKSETDQTTKLQCQCNLNTTIIMLH